MVWSTQVRNWQYDQCLGTYVSVILNIVTDFKFIVFFLNKFFFWTIKFIVFNCWFGLLSFIKSTSMLNYFLHQRYNGMFELSSFYFLYSLFVENKLVGAYFSLWVLIITHLVCQRCFQPLSVPTGLWPSLPSGYYGDL